MKWKKLGHIYNPADHQLPLNCVGFAQSPQALAYDDFVRIYFSTRAKDANGKFRSQIAFADFDEQFNCIGHSKDTVIPLGGLGTFDEHGIFPFSPVRVGDKLYAYTCGWSRRVSVSVETSTGLAVSEDNGLTFQKYGAGPVLSSSLQEPVLVGDSFVKYYEGQWHMWYIFGTKWMPANAQEPPARIYKIGHATSADGINWQKEEGRKIISDVLGDTECQALPTVVEVNNRYHMYFCFRQATDFRANHTRGYRLGYAYSDDLKNWTRADEAAGISCSEDGWDSEMMCYPNLFQWKNRVFFAV